MVEANVIVVLCCFCFLSLYLLRLEGKFRETIICLSDSFWKLLTSRQDVLIEVLSCW